MHGSDVIDIAVQAMYVLVKAGAPILLTTLGVGLMMAMFQTLTQIQEMTLTFIPKILAGFIALMVFGPFITNVVNTFTLELFDRIAALE